MYVYFNMIKKIQVTSNLLYYFVIRVYHLSCLHLIIKAEFTKGFRLPQKKSLEILTNFTLKDS